MSDLGQTGRRGRSGRGRPSPASLGVVKVGADFTDEYPGADRTCTEAYASVCRTGEALLGELDRRVRPTLGIPQAAATALAVIDGAGAPLTPSQVADRVCPPRRAGHRGLPAGTVAPAKVTPRYAGARAGLPFGSGWH